MHFAEAEKVRRPGVDLLVIIHITVLLLRIDHDDDVIELRGFESTKARRHEMSGFLCDACYASMYGATITWSLTYTTCF